MAINQINTSNTFYGWLNTTNEIVNTLNLITDGGSGNTFYVNTNLQIANNLTVGGNLTIGGNVSLGTVGLHELTVSGNANIGGTLIVGSNVILGNISITNNITSNTVF